MSENEKIIKFYSKITKYYIFLIRFYKNFIILHFFKFKEILTKRGILKNIVLNKKLTNDTS